MMKINHQKKSLRQSTNRSIITVGNLVSRVVLSINTVGFIYKHGRKTSITSRNTHSYKTVGRACRKYYRKYYRNNHRKAKI